MVKALMHSHSKQSICVPRFKKIINKLSKGRKKRQRPPMPQKAAQGHCTPQKKTRSAAFRSDLPATPVNKRPRKLNSGEYSICGVSKNGSPLKELPPARATIMVKMNTVLDGGPMCLTHGRSCIFRWCPVRNKIRTICPTFCRATNRCASKMIV